MIMQKNVKTVIWRFLTLLLLVGMAATAEAQDVAMLHAVLVPGAQMQPAAMAAAPQVKDDLFAGTEKFAQGASDVTEVNLDPKMMGMVGSSGKDKDKDDTKLARKMNFMVIHTYTYDKPGMYKMEDVEAYRKKLEDGTWNCSIHVRSTKSGSTDICSRVGPDHESSEMVILTAQPKELTFIHMSGHMSLEELTKMNGNTAGLNHR